LLWWVTMFAPTRIAMEERPVDRHQIAAEQFQLM
jgi:hypothetical protein